MQIAIVAAAVIGGLGCAALMAAITLEDLTVRLIDRRLCVLLGMCGVLFQGALHGTAGLIHGAFWAAALVALCFAASRVSAHGPGASAPATASIGGGDVRCIAALALASGAAAPLGFAACFSAAALWGAVQRARGRLLRREAFAFAPFLCVWLLVVIAGHIPLPP